MSLSTKSQLGVRLSRIGICSLLSSIYTVRLHRRERNHVYVVVPGVWRGWRPSVFSSRPGLLPRRESLKVHELVEGTVPSHSRLGSSVEPDSMIVSWGGRTWNTSLIDQFVTQVPLPDRRRGLSSFLPLLVLVPSDPEEILWSGSVLSLRGVCTSDRFETGNPSRYLTRHRGGFRFTTSVLGVILS